MMTYFGCLVLMAIAVTLGGAHAHGGGLHRWTLNKNVPLVVKSAVMRPYSNLLVGVMNRWQVLDTTALYQSYTLPFFTPKANISVAGTVSVYSYLTSTCTDSLSSGLFPFLSFSETKLETTIEVNETRKLHNKTRTCTKQVTVPYGYGNKTVFGYAFTGDCNSPGDLYRNDTGLGDSRFNMHYWNSEGIIGEGMNMTDPAGVPGIIWGAAPQSWNPRVPMISPDGRSIMTAFMLIVEDGPVFCSPIDWVADPKSVLDLGTNCSAGDVPGGK